jgi:hypothetical protein
MSADMALWCRECQDCARGKIYKHLYSPMENIITPKRKFAHIYLDLVRPLPTSREDTTIS